MIQVGDEMMINNVVGEDEYVDLGLNDFDHDEDELLSQK